MTIGRDRWQMHLKTRGEHYHTAARGMEELAARRPETGAATSALAFHALAEVMERARLGRLTRNQHVLLRLGEIIAWAECAGSLARRAGRALDGALPPKADRRFTPPALAAAARVFAREAALEVAGGGLRWICGAEPAASARTAPEVAGLHQALSLPAIHRAQAGLLADMDAVADALYDRTPSSAGSSSAPSKAI
jgi:hypothetical protein